MPTTARKSATPAKTARRMSGTRRAASDSSMRPVIVSTPKSGSSGSRRCRTARTAGVSPSASPVADRAATVMDAIGCWGTVM